ncbi:unnamed protein product [Choristocarpus tenellus]
MGIPCTMEDGSPLTVDQNFHLDAVFHAGTLVDAPCQDKGLLLNVNVTFTEVQVASHLPHSSTSNGVAAVVGAEPQKRTHYEVSFESCSFNLDTFKGGSFGRLGKQAKKILDELATHAVGGRGARGNSKKRAVKSRSS